MKISNSPFKVLRDPDAAVKFAEDQTKLLNKIRNNISSRAGIREAFTEQTEKKSKPLTELLSKQLPLLEAAVSGELKASDEELRQSAIDALIRGQQNLSAEELAHLNALKTSPFAPTVFEPKSRTEIASLLDKINAGQTLTASQIKKLKKLTKDINTEKSKREINTQVSALIHDMIDKFQKERIDFTVENMRKYYNDARDEFVKSGHGDKFDLIMNKFQTELRNTVAIARGDPGYLEQTDANEILEQKFPGLISMETPAFIASRLPEQQPEFVPPKAATAEFVIDKVHPTYYTIPGSGFYLNRAELDTNSDLIQVSDIGAPIQNRVLAEIGKLTPGLRQLLFGTMKEINTDRKNNSSVITKNDITNYQKLMRIKGDDKKALLTKIKPASTKQVLAAGPAKENEEVNKKFTDKLLKSISGITPIDVTNIYIARGLTPKEAYDSMPVNFRPSNYEVLEKMTSGNGLFTLGNKGHSAKQAPAHWSGHGRPLHGMGIDRCSVKVPMRGGCQGMAQNAPPMVYYQPQDVANRVGLLTGAIDAGNNAPQVKNELALLLDMMARNKWIDHQQYGSAINKYLRY